MDSLEESEEIFPPERSAVSNVALEVVILLLIIPVFIFERTNKIHIHSRDAKRTQCLIRTVLLSSTLHQTFRIARSMECLDCRITYAVMEDMRVLSRGINALFLIHRAKLAQGIQPIISKKWFEKIFPAIAILYYVGGLYGTAKSALEDTFVCVPYTDQKALHFCWNSNDQNYDAGAKRAVTLAAVFAFLWAVFFLTLFVVPMYRVYRADLGAMNENQLRQRLKLKRLLYWSVVLTLLNQLISTFYMMRIIHRSPVTLAMFTIGLFDPPINVWTSWLMVTRHREYIERMVCCRGREEPEVGLYRLNSDLTNAVSRSNRIMQLLRRQSSMSFAAPTIEME